MFRAWQLGVTLVATLLMIAAINEGTPFFIAITSALLSMSILASDPEPRTSLRGVGQQDRP
jgi:hypothetical protein